MYNSVVCFTFNVTCSCMDCLREETVSVSGHSSAQSCSGDQTVTVQGRSVLDVRVQSDFASSFAHSG